MNYIQRLRAEADQAKSLSEQWQRRYESELQPAADRKLQELERQWDEQLQALETKLKAEQEQHAKLAAELRRRMHPSGNLSVFVLNSVRSGAANPSEPVNPVELPRSSAMFALSISLPGETPFHTFRMVIFNDRHRLIKRTRQLRPDHDDVLTILLDPELFRPGRYSLVLEGFKKAGGQEIVDRYPFQITRAR